MKRILRIFVIDTLGLFVVSNVISGISFKDGLMSLFLAGIALGISSIVVKPIINILLLPINLLTFNLFKWASSAITLYIVTLVVPGFVINGLTFIGYQSKWFDIPAVHLEGILAFIAISFLLSIFSATVHWLIK